jgi:hypothetical protein
MNRKHFLTKSRPWLSGLTLCVLVSLCGAARADLYRYQNKDGTTLITSEKRKDLKLLEVIEGGGGGGGGATNERFAKLAKESREKAAEARARQPQVGRGEDRYDDLIREASQAYQIPTAFIKGVIRYESNFNPLAVSRTGAMGLMQLMPGTARFLGVKDAFDPRQNIFGGTKLLRILSDQYNGDINLILAAYNAGEGAVEKHDGIPYRATQDYVRRVYHFYKHYQSLERLAAQD